MSRQGPFRCGPRGRYRRARPEDAPDARERTSGPRQRERSRSRLYRRGPGEAKILGVCGGIADYFGFNAGLVRFAWLISLVIFTFTTLVGYFFLAWLLDQQPVDLFESEEEEAFWRQVRTEPSQTLSGLRHKFRTLELRLRGLEAHVTSPGYKIDQELNRERP